MYGVYRFSQLLNFTPNQPLLLLSPLLPLPAGCSGKSFELQAKKRGLKVYGSERFAVGNTNGASAVRAAVCAPQNEDELKRGLSIIKELFEEYEFVEAPTWIV
jgi:DNA-binding transcriptional MocR family regulator